MRNILSRNFLYKFSTSKSSLGNAVYIVAAKRTAISSFMSKLSSVSAPELGGIAIKGAMDSINLDPKTVDQVILGNVLSAGIGQAPARQAALKGGLLVSTPVITINKVCSSGLKSVVFGSQSIALGHADTVITGGFESMSNAPFFVLDARKGLGYGDKKFIDCIAHDGLTDPFNKISMGLCAEKTATDFKITREAQDDYCKMSYKRHIEAAKSGIFKGEIVPVVLKEKGKEEIFDQDQQCRRYKEDKVSQLQPAFSKTGTITAANASKINDGASAIILMSESKMKSLGLKPLARIVNYADAEIDPIDFSIAPQFATKKLLTKSGLTLSNIDLFQYNEAFSVVALANMKLLDISDTKCNIYGGAVSMGHPIGMSGARILQTLLTGLKNKKGKYGIAGICNGGGGSTALLVQNLQQQTNHQQKKDDRNLS